MNGAEKVAFLGLGAMGQRMAQRLVAAGYDVTVWSRSGVPREAAALSQRTASTPAVAVADADVVFSMVSDDAASRAVWLAEERGALGAMRRGALAVECSTLTPGWTAELAQAARHHALDFVAAPVVGSRPQAEAGTLVVLAGAGLDGLSDSAAVERLRQIASPLASSLVHVGSASAASHAKLIVNVLFGVQVAALAELLGWARQTELDPAQLVRVLEGLPVLSGAAKVAVQAMLAQRFEPLFPVELVAKDLRYAVATATAYGAVPVTASAAEVFDSAERAGLGKQNLTAVAKLYDPPSPRRHDSAGSTATSTPPRAVT